MAFRALAREDQAAHGVQQVLTTLGLRLASDGVGAQYQRDVLRPLADGLHSAPGELVQGGATHEAYFARKPSSRAFTSGHSSSRTLYTAL